MFKLVHLKECFKLMCLYFFPRQIYVGLVPSPALPGPNAVHTEAPVLVLHKCSALHGILNISHQTQTGAAARPF